MNRPIGIFDSGIGGLTVCKSIHNILPDENLIYFGDTARFPYGTRSKETIVRYSREIVNYLINRNVKMIVIACNTSSAAALDILRNEIDIPIIGVIEAGARAACKKCSSGAIGIIGTRATVNSQSYVRAITGLNPDITIFQQQATLFVTLTEEGMVDNEISHLTAKEYIQDMYIRGVRTLILGCTHFPLLKKTITDVFPDLSLVDTGMEIAREVKAILLEKNLKNKSLDKIGSIELYASDITESYMRLKDVFFGKTGARINKLIIDSHYEKN